MPQQRLTLAIALLCAGTSAAEAACPRAGDGIDVAIGIRAAPPFIVSDPIRGQRGLTFDLWASIERELQRDGVIGRTAFVDCPLGDQLQALASGELDVVISPLTITAERLERFDFTHQYLGSGLTVAHRSDGAVDFGYAAAILRQTIAREGVPRAILIFLVANLILAALIARELRRSEAFRVVASEPLPLRLTRYALETIVRTAGLKGLGDGARSTAARVVEVFIAVVGTLLSATVFGLLTTALVGSMAVSREVTPTDLLKIRVATLSHSTAQAFLEELATGSDTGAVSAGPGGDLRLDPLSVRPRTASPGATAHAMAGGRCVEVWATGPEATCIATASWQEAMMLLASREVDVVLGDWAQLTYLSRLPDFAGKVSVQSTTFRLEPYGWGVSPRRPELRAAIDRALMDRVRSTQWRFMVQEYMGSGSISPE